MSVTERLGQRAKVLEAEGADPMRVELLRRARRFKRSWIEMAEALCELRGTHAYTEWGYEDLYTYCEQELLIKKRTVDKLTGSYSTIQRHAPQMLDPNDEEHALPSVEAVNYFARAIEGKSRNDDEPPPSHPQQVVDNLRTAVFEEAQPLSALRQQFNQVFFPKSPAEESLKLLQKANSTANRLSDILPDVEGLTNDRMVEVASALDGLISDIQALMPEARERAQLARAS